MGGVGRAAADAQDEQPAAAVANAPQLGDTFLTGGRVDFGDDLRRFLQVLDWE